MYGETTQIQISGIMYDGLSPRVRGNPAGTSYTRWTQGSIPACTGKPVPSISLPKLPKVYPRVYGETYPYVCPSERHGGLSPRVRGNPPADRLYARVSGSIPACTGKPPTRQPPRSRRWVYPRVYGETSMTIDTFLSRTGLSPRVRGNQRCPLLVGRPLGSIPACTGKPRRRS